MKILVSRNFLITLLLVYNSTYSSVIAFSYYTLVFSLIILIFIFLKNRLKIDPLFYKFSILFLLVSIYLYLTLPYFDTLLTGYNYLKFLYAYLSIKLIGANFFKNIVSIAYYGSIISFPFYILQLLNYDLAFSLVGFIQNSFDFLSWRNDQMANNIIFTINADGALRNSGFMWEPKGFASFIIIAIIFRLFLNNLVLFDKKIIVFFLAIISTFSTTGILALFLILTFYFINKNTIVLISIFPLFIIVSYSVFINSEILYKKILYEISLQNEYKTLLTKKDYESDIYSLGRTGSLIVDFNDFIKKPIFGYGFTRENRTQSDYVKLVRVNGLSDLLAIYGLGIIIFFYRHYIFLKLLNTKKYKFLLIIFMTFICIYFASTLTGHPFWTSLLFVNLITPKKHILSKNQNE
tara:strand:- start:251 stop:1471 length:1221 start_codon:yes stop_codon:yes gene_type:complete